MPEFPASVRIVRFGVFEVDLYSGELKKRGARVKLQSQPFLLLVTLLKKQGELVTREEICSALWPDGTFIDFDRSLGTALNKLREVLGDSAVNPRFIETLPRRGYRFIAPVEIVDPEPKAIQKDEAPLVPVLVPDPVPAAEPKPGWVSRKRWPLLALLLLILAAGGALLMWNQRPRPAPYIRSLAVLPLSNLSGDPGEDYFSDGMTDELITELGQLSELRVISRTSVMTYKATRKTLPEIARELNVDAVVEGTVLRSGGQVRITAQLVEASSDRHLWAQSYEEQVRNVLTLQRKVARAIAGQIRIKLSSQEQMELKNTQEVNAEAHEEYLKGRFFWNKRTGEDLKRAVDHFNRAIAHDPNYAQAYSGLADSYALMGDWEYGVLSPQEALPKARAAATKAIAIDGRLGEAHTSLAFALDLFDWDWSSAEREYQKAIELNPSYATAHQWYAWHLVVMRKNTDAVAEMRKARDLDPLSLIIGADQADILHIARLYDDSIEQSRRILELDPRFAVAHYQLGQALAQKHSFPEAINELETSIAVSGGNRTFVSNLAYAYALSGNKTKAQDLLKGLLSPTGGRFSSPAEIALVYVGLGDGDEAFRWLDKAYAERFNPSVLFRPAFDPLRTDPRFHQLLNRIGFE